MTKLKVSKEKLAEFRARMSVLEMAKFFKVSQSTINRWLELNAIKRTVKDKIADNVIPIRDGFLEEAQ